MASLPESNFLRHPAAMGTRGNREFDNVAVRDGLAIFEWDDWCGFGDKPDPEYYGVRPEDVMMRNAWVYQDMEEYIRLTDRYVLPNMPPSGHHATGSLRRADQSRDQYD